MKKRRFRWTSFRVIVLGFALLILVGAGLLALPVSSRQEGSVPFLDCLFTAVSSACVTGLAVRDTATCWSPFGQAVLLVLIQIGGLGVVVAALSLSFILGRRIDLQQRSMLQDSISAPQVGGIVRLTRFILITTGAAELIGACLLLPVFWREFGPWKGIWYALFHSVSAFCNAGFDLMGVKEPSSSLTSLAFDPLANIAVMLLIIVGGIGFTTWDDVRTNAFRWKKYRLQTKLALSTTGVLILIPAVCFWVFEMPDIPGGQRVLPALFQSVTLRTAGFNTVDLTRIGGGGQVMMILWMLVGGCPGSTAGGMKTVTMAVLLLSAHAVFQKKPNVNCFGRRIAEDVVRQAAALAVMYAALFLVSGLVIRRIEDLPLSWCLFETASAVGTVGLSMGITGGLGTASRIILMLLMFIGRVGGLTLIYATQPKSAGAAGVLPVEKVTVG